MSLDILVFLIAFFSMGGIAMIISQHYCLESKQTKEEEKHKPWQKPT